MSMDEDEELLTSEEAFRIVVEAGIKISTTGGFRKWRERHQVYVVAGIPRKALERAIRESIEPGPGRL